MQLLYEQFLDCGHTPELFYRLSINEAIDLIASYNRRKEQHEKEEFQKLISVLDIFGANFIEKVLIMLGKGNDSETKFSLTEYVPELFSEYKNKMVPEQEKKTEPAKPTLSPEMQEYKAQRILHAYRVNQARHRSDK